MRFSCLHTKQLDSNINQMTRRGFRISRSGTHKKGKTICYGLLLALLTIVGLSLSIFSSDTSALLYNVDTIPFSSPVSFPTDITNSNVGGDILSSSEFGKKFGFGIPLDEQASISFAIEPWQYILSPTQDGRCSYNSRVSSFWSSPVRRLSNSTTTSYSIYMPYYESRLNYYVDSHVSHGPLLSDIASCNAFGPIDNIDTSNFPLYAFGQPNWSSFPPYRWNYNGIFAHDVNTNDGLHSEARLDFSDFFSDESFPQAYHYLDIPLGLFKDSSEVVSGTSIEFHSLIDFDSDSPSDLFELSPDFSVDFSINGYLHKGSGTTNFWYPSSQSTSCSFELIDNRSNPDIYPWTLSITCDLVTTEDWSDGLFAGSLSLYIPQSSRTTSNSMFNYSPSNMIFYQLDVVTNGDTTPAGSFGIHTIEGVDSDNVAGSAHASIDISSHNVDWISSLSNLFVFNFINPFAPIFSLFSDSTSCASIPTLASMIHSEETVVCPFFSTTTRAIVTPIIGLSSMMLVFGFVIRWLGARSGNFIEDSGGIDSGSYHFENKFRRKPHA